SGIAPPLPPVPPVATPPPVPPPPPPLPPVVAPTLPPVSEPPDPPVELGLFSDEPQPRLISATARDAARNALMSPQYQAAISWQQIPHPLPDCPHGLETLRFDFRRGLPGRAGRQDPAGHAVAGGGRPIEMDGVRRRGPGSGGDQRHRRGGRRGPDQGYPADLDQARGGDPLRGAGCAVPDSPLIPRSPRQRS